ncbi:MAG: hypothetical protein ABIJ92_04620 [Candidatus Aenigmatarchaeota archaeon]
MVTTIQVSENLQKVLTERKFSNSESYEEVIWDMIEDTAELSEETKKEIELSRKEIIEGKFYTMEQIKKEMKN